MLRSVGQPVSPRPQPHSRCVANARSSAPANATATSTGSSMRIVSPCAVAGARAAPTSTTIDEAEPFADAAPDVGEAGAADLFEAAAGGPTRFARL